PRPAPRPLPDFSDNLPSTSTTALCLRPYLTAMVVDTEDKCGHSPSLNSIPAYRCKRSGNRGSPTLRTFDRARTRKPRRTGTRRAWSYHDEIDLRFNPAPR